MSLPLPIKPHTHLTLAGNSKKSIELGNFIRGKTVARAKVLLEGVIAMKVAVPMKRFNRLWPLNRYDTDEMLPTIHAVEFLGEPAIDLGGLRREMFTLVLQQLAVWAPAFEGREGAKCPTQHFSSFENRVYYKAGVLMGMALLHCGIRPAFLAPCSLRCYLHWKGGRRLPQCW